MSQPYAQIRQNIHVIQSSNKELALREHILLGYARGDEPVQPTCTLCYAGYNSCHTALFLLG
jgi:hypothetical protein